MIAANFFSKEEKENMLEHFQKGEFADWLSKGILLAGEALQAHFPYQSDDVNELSDEISFGKSWT